MNLRPRRPLAAIATPAATGVLVLGLLALTNHALVRRVERQQPPRGTFIDVDGMRLHVSDEGFGSPIVLIHGNTVSGDDFNTSGVADILRQHHRVIIIDRPGFGYSERTRDRIWTANEQADLLHQAFAMLGVVKPVVVGHSWGAIVAMALAVRHEADLAGVVALSGYYFPTLRPDVPLVTLGAIPLLGDLLRHTVSPFLSRMTMPLLKRVLFSPGPVTPRFEAEFSTEMAVRPSQLRATSEDGALMIPAALTLRDSYQALALPVTIMAGEGDKLVFKRRAEQLHATIVGSQLHLIPGVGHMIHHQATDAVASAITAMAEQVAAKAVSAGERANAA